MVRRACVRTHGQPASQAAGWAYVWPLVRGCGKGRTSEQLGSGVLLSVTHTHTPSLSTLTTMAGPAHEYAATSRHPVLEAGYRVSG